MLAASTHSAHMRRVVADQQETFSNLHALSTDDQAKEVLAFQEMCAEDDFIQGVRNCLLLDNIRKRHESIRSHDHGTSIRPSPLLKPSPICSPVDVKSSPAFKTGCSTDAHQNILVNAMCIPQCIAFSRCECDVYSAMYFAPAL